MIKDHWNHRVCWNHSDRWDYCNHRANVKPLLDRAIDPITSTIKPNADDQILS